MRRVVVTPKAIPRTAEIITLAGYKKPKTEADGAGAIDWTAPEGTLPGDDFFTVLASGNNKRDGIRKGDIYIVLKTDNVEKGDVVAILYHKDDGKKVACVGYLDFDECYYVLDYFPGYWPHEFHRAKYKISGRVVEIQRNGRRVETKLKLRPIHPLAKVYQFRKAG